MVDYLHLEWLRTGKVNGFYYQVRKGEEAIRLGLPMAESDQIRLIKLLAREKVIKLKDVYSKELPKGTEILEGYPIGPSWYRVTVNEAALRSYQQDLHTKIQTDQDDDANEAETAVRLFKNDNLLHLATGTNSYQIAKFHSGSKIDELLSFIINSRADTLVTLGEIRSNTSLVELKNIAEVVKKAGLRPLEGLFITNLQPRKIQITTSLQLTQSSFEKLITAFSPKIPKNPQN